MIIIKKLSDLCCHYTCKKIIITEEHIKLYELAYLVLCKHSKIVLKEWLNKEQLLTSFEFKEIDNREIVWKKLVMYKNNLLQ